MCARSERVKDGTRKARCNQIGASSIEVVASSFELRTLSTKEPPVITRIEALRFRSLRYVRQDVGAFQLLVGANGSGKSSFLDVVVFLGDLLRAGPLGAIAGDARTGVLRRTSDPDHLCWMRAEGSFELAIELAIPDSVSKSISNGKARRARYEVRLRTSGDERGVRLAAERLWLAPERTPGEPGSHERQRTLFPASDDPPESIVHEPNRHTPPGWRKVVDKIEESGNDYYYAETSNWKSPFRLGPTRSALANLPEDEQRFPVATWVRRVLIEGVQRIALNAESLRNPSPPGTPTRFLPDGSNLPWVVDALQRSDNERFYRWIDHVRTAIPSLKTVTSREREEDRHRYLVVEFDNGLQAPSWIVSDGTLRLLALTLLAYLKDETGVYLVEEPENGIHPKAVETVFQALSSVYGSQVLCASHSPVVLRLAQPKDIFCFAKTPDGATDIVRGDEHPYLRDWQGLLDLGTLFASGVLG